MMLKRDALEASAEETAQELLADEAATKPAGTKKAKKGKHKKETVDGVRVGNRVTGAVKKHTTYKKPNKPARKTRHR